MVFQEPNSVLNPVYTIGWQIEEGLRAHGMKGQEARAKAIDILKKVGIPDAETRVDYYPHQFSGRPEAAHRHRDGAGAQPRPDPGRRADHRTGCDRAGRDPGSAAPGQGRVRRQRADHHPQHGRHRRPGRPVWCDVPRACGGAGRRGTGLLPSEPRYPSGCSPRCRASASSWSCAIWTAASSSARDDWRDQPIAVEAKGLTITYPGHLMQPDFVAWTASTSRSAAPRCSPGRRVRLRQVHHRSCDRRPAEGLRRSLRCWAWR